MPPPGCGCTGGSTARSWPWPSSRSPRGSASSAWWPRLGGRGDAARPRCVQVDDRRQGRAVGNQLGVGLAIIRLASLGSLPLTGMADRFGRRRMILTVTMRPGVHCRRRGQSRVLVVRRHLRFRAPAAERHQRAGPVEAAEETGAQRPKSAVALVAAGYAEGPGSRRSIHSLAAGALGFRGIFVLAARALAVVYVLRLGRGTRPVRWRRPPRTIRSRPRCGRSPVSMAGGHLGSIVFAVAIVTGPANSFVFLYAQNVFKMAGYVSALMVVAAGVRAGRAVGWADGWPIGSAGDRRAAWPWRHGVDAGARLRGRKERAPRRVQLGVLSGGLLRPRSAPCSPSCSRPSVRASVTGWSVTAGVVGAVCGLVAFGAIADVGNRFAFGGRRDVPADGGRGGALLATPRDEGTGTGVPVAGRRLRARSPRTTASGCRP